MPPRESTTKPRRSPRFPQIVIFLEDPTPQNHLRRIHRAAQEPEGSSDRPVQSARELRNQPRKCVSEKSFSVVSKKPRKDSGTGLKKSRGFCDSVEGVRILRRSSRISGQCGIAARANEDEQLGIVRKCSRGSLGGAPEVSSREESGGDESEKCKIEGSEEAVDGWTGEQEAALQRAYLVMKPTPRFWKKVARLVPGKSTQDCFDKLNSDFATPPQTCRTRRTNSSLVSHIQLSPSEVLKPNQPRSKKTVSNRQKTHKDARLLLKEHYHSNKVHEADLFSVLEPSYQTSAVFSTPKNLVKRKEPLQMCNERSSSGKRMLSRFSDSGKKALASPPVLKPLKNMALHEKYIDQLRNRNATRQRKSKKSVMVSSKMENGKENLIPCLEVVRTAKMALVSDARDAITKIQQMQANSKENSSDLDDDSLKSDEDESEFEM